MLTLKIFIHVLTCIIIATSGGLLTLSLAQILRPNCFGEHEASMRVFITALLIILIICSVSVAVFQYDTMFMGE
jgi:hypothetical protein